jgi:hypothetical protein
VHLMHQGGQGHSLTGPLTCPVAAVGRRALCCRHGAAGPVPPARHCRPGAASTTLPARCRQPGVTRPCCQPSGTSPAGPARRDQHRAAAACCAPADHHGPHRLAQAPRR